MILEQDIFTALRSFIGSILPGVEIVQSQDNGVSMPVGGFITMNNVGMRRLSTNTPTYVDPVTTTGTKSVSADIEYTMQIDFYGDTSGDWAAQIHTLFRDQYAYDQFPVGISPLYADDPMQVPLITGEETWLQRWTMKAVMQYNPIVVVPQQFAAAVSVNIINVM